MMFSSNTCRFLVFLSLSLSTTAETIRGAERELGSQSPVELGKAADYVILGKTGITNVPGSSVTGNIAVSPVVGTSMTGFSFTGTGAYLESAQLTDGKAYAASYDAPTPTQLTTAVSNMEAAYNDAASRPNSDAARINLAAGLLDGTVLTEGVYTFSTGVTLTGDITFHGTANDIFIVQIAGSLVQAAGKEVILTGGAKAENIFWQVAGTVAVGGTAKMKGILLVKTAVTFTTGSTLNGRVLTQTACNLQMATITQPSREIIIIS
jgi:hypothetical protein